MRNARKQKTGFDSRKLRAAAIPLVELVVILFLAAIALLSVWRLAQAAEPVAPAPVVAMEAANGRAVKAGELVMATAAPLLLVSRNNLRAEISPHAVALFEENGTFRLLRGSAALTSASEAAARTASARLDFIGRALLSYDHGEQTTSAFVLEGEARMVNPQNDSNTLRLERFHGATLVVGQPLPQLVRQLDVGAVDSWLKGFSWDPEKRKGLLEGMPGGEIGTEAQIPAHLKNAKIEDYFSAIDTADEFHQPNYYEKKFADPDQVVAEENSRQGARKQLSPEEAALISLPKTAIDLGFDLGPEFLTAEEKTKEITRPEPPKEVGSRKLASITAAAKAAKKRKRSVQTAPEGDPDVNLTLRRLESAHSERGAVSTLPAESRGPASAGAPVVSDPVYDYSQNF